MEWDTQVTVLLWRYAPLQRTSVITVIPVLRTALCARWEASKGQDGLVPVFDKNR